MSVQLSKCVTGAYCDSDTVEYSRKKVANKMSSLTSRNSELNWEGRPEKHIYSIELTLNDLEQKYL